MPVLSGLAHCMPFGVWWWWEFVAVLGVWCVCVWLFKQRWTSIFTRRRTLLKRSSNWPRFRAKINRPPRCSAIVFRRSRFPFLARRTIDGQNTQKAARTCICMWTRMTLVFPSKQANYVCRFALSLHWIAKCTCCIYFLRVFFTRVRWNCQSRLQNLSVNWSCCGTFTRNCALIVKLLQFVVNEREVVKLLTWTKAILI